MALLSEMVVVQLEPNINTYSALNSACEKNRRWQRQQTKALLSEMVVAQPEPSIIPCSALHQR
eukprot:2360957-Pyramimonas_sp.AAC.1